MSIILGLVARGSVILAESHESTKTNFLQAAETILSRIPPNSSKLSYVFESWLFHYVSDNGIVYLTVADYSAGRRVPFAFLGEMRKQFTNKYNSNQIADALAYGLNEFSKDIHALIDQFNTSPPNDPVKQAQSDLANVKDIMVHNVEAILSRGERIELLVDRTDQMSSQSQAFRRRAVAMRRKMWWRNAKVLAVGSTCVVIVLVILFATIFGRGEGH